MDACIKVARLELADDRLRTPFPPKFIMSPGADVPDLGRALAEFVRVLRPSGHLVLSDSRGLIGLTAGTAVGAIYAVTSDLFGRPSHGPAPA